MKRIWSLLMNLTDKFFRVIKRIRKIKDFLLNNTCLDVT